MEELELLTRLRETLASQYDVERVLGHGGMGMVVLARDRALDRPVAIKVISPNVDVSARHRQRFLQEARIVAKLRHPNIVAVYAAGEANGLLYFVMEFVPGESLRDLLERDRCCRPDRSEAILRDLIQAVAYAHARGVVHRDIKPENVLLDHDSGRAMLADFGVAQALTAQQETRLTGPGIVVGSPAYMSPEQAAGVRDLDGRSDIYALGLVGYEMLAGVPAFHGDDVVAVLAKQLTEDPPPLAGRAPGASPAVVVAITRALEKDIEERWQTAEEMARALDGNVEPAEAHDGSISTAETIDTRASPPPVAPPLRTPSPDSPHPDQPRLAPFVGPGRPPPRAGRSRRLASTLATVSAALLFAVPVVWFAWPRQSSADGTLNAEAIPTLIVPLDVQSLDSALALGRQAGAGRIVTGESRRAGDSLVVVANLHDVASGGRIARLQRASVAGVDPRPLFDLLARELLLRGDPTPAGETGIARPSQP